jgi:hypothetical protein
MKACPTEWRKEGQNLLLERLMSAPRDYQNRIDFLRANTAFGLEESYEPVQWMTSAHCAPFSRWIGILNDKEADEGAHHMAKEIMNLALENIQFNKNDEKYIRGLIR